MARLATEQIAATAPIVDLRAAGVDGSPAVCSAGASNRLRSTVRQTTGLTSGYLFKPQTQFELATSDPVT